MARRGGGGCAADLVAAASGVGAVDVRVAASTGSRDSGRIVAVTRCHSSASSGAERAHAPPRPWAAGSRPIRLADMPPAIRAASLPAPQKVSKRLAPLIAPPVSCATHRPLASVAVERQEHRRAQRHERRIGGDAVARGDRHAERAERARPGQFPEEDVARDSRASARGPRRAGRASRRRSPPCWRLRPGADCARAAAARPRHIRGRSGRHSRSASRLPSGSLTRPEPWMWRKNSSIGSAAQASSSPLSGQRAILDLGAGVIEHACPAFVDPAAAGGAVGRVQRTRSGGTR